jgi:hypothetical protein
MVVYDMAFPPIPKPKGQGQPSPKVQPRKSRRRPLGESTARQTIAMMRSIASHKPISPFHLMAADEMERLLNEVLEYRRKNG